MSGLVLSLFPGIGLLDMAFEQEGFCVVRGPDVLWGGDIRRFHPPAGKFDGVIGGPPCKGESNLAYLNGTVGATLKHEFVRVVNESDCDWWVMEAVREHRDLGIESGSYRVLTLNNRWLGQEQNRKRYFHSNLPLAAHLEVAVFDAPTFKHAVLAGHGSAVGSVVNGIAKYSWRDQCVLQGLPDNFDLPGFKRQAAYEAVGNGVPLPMGRAVARAVKEAIGATHAV